MVAGKSFTALFSKPEALEVALELAKSSGEHNSSYPITLEVPPLTQKLLVVASGTPCQKLLVVLPTKSC